MPTYEYKCSNCGHEFEKFQSMSAAPIRKCPKCGKAKVKRLIGTGAGLIFKGSGFYITDYRSEKYKEAAKKESSASTGGSGDAKSSSTTGGDGKAAPAAPAKTETKPAKPAKAKTD